MLIAPFYTVMIEINLLKYLNKSFSEIYEIEHSIEVQPQKKRKFSLFKIYLVSNFILLTGATIITFILILKEPENNEKVKTVSENILLDNTNKKDTLLSEYKVIGTISIADNLSTKGSSEFVVDIKLPKNTPETTDKDKIIKQTQTVQNINPDSKANVNKENTSKKIQDKKTDKQYYIISIENIDDKTYKLLLKNAKGKNITITKKWTVNNKTWDVYVEENGTKVYIGGYEVKKIKTFKSKDEAILFAKKLSRKIIIKSNDDKIDYYNIEISNFNSVDEAKRYAKNINISVKVLKILKKK